MNWIIRNLNKLKFHTDLNILLSPIENDIENLRWIISDLEINTDELDKLPINHEKDWFMISFEEMNLIRKADVQIVWGAFCGIENNIEMKVDQIKIPTAKGNDKIWKNGNLQIKNSKIEIIAFDSSYTIIKFTDKKMSNKFKEYFDEAIELENYKWGE